MKKIYPVVFVLLWVCSKTVLAQTDGLLTDSIDLVVTGEKIEPEKTTRFYIPKKAAMFSAAFPGLGQAYNRKYWKIPILYAGIAATGYGIWWNDSFYTQYRNAYIDIRDSDPKSERYLEVLPPGYDFDEQSADWKRWFESQLLKKKDSYRRDRDLLVIVMAGVYILNIIDANVDAHLSDFDISNDLSLNVAPMLPGSFAGSLNTGYGVSLRLNF